MSASPMYLSMVPSSTSTQPARSENAAGEEREMLVEETGDLGRRKPLGHGRESDDVGEHNGELALFGGNFLVRMAGDQLTHQPARHVALERAQPAQHGVEGPRLLVQFADLAARQGRHLPQVQTADLGALGGDATDWTGEQAAQDDGQENGEHRDGQTDQSAVTQAVHGVHGVFHGQPGADLPGDRAVVIELFRRGQVGLVSNLDVQHLYPLGLQRLHSRPDLTFGQGSQHEIADPIDRDDRRVFAQLGMGRNQGRMGQDFRVALQDEHGGLLSVADVGHELGQPWQGDQAGKKAQISAVAADRPPQVEVSRAVQVHQFVPANTVARLDLFQQGFQRGGRRLGGGLNF
jgi:hypothetical protein